MIGKLAVALARSGVDLDSVRLAEILWVATHAQLSGPAAAEATVPDEDTTDAEPDRSTVEHPVERPASVSDAGEAIEEPLYLVPRPAVPSEVPEPEAVEVRLPGPVALPGRLQLGRSLRRFKRERPVSRIATLDVDATIKAYGDTGLLTPLLRPGMERWFDVALVVDGAPTMDVWAQTTMELTKLLESHGAFRRVRRWRLVTRSGKPWLLNDAGAQHRLRQLAEPEGRQLTMVVSDCVGAQWYESPVWSAIEDWGRHGPVVLVQMLPLRLWEFTALGPADVQLTGYRPGQPNRGLRVVPPWWWLEVEPPTGALPVVALNENDLSRWARMVMGGAGIPVLGVIPEPGLAQENPAAGLDADPAARVAAFRSTVSPEAYQLAVCLAAVPIRLPIARIVQYGVLDDHEIVHLAEVFSSGLLRRVTPPDSAVPVDDVDYDFVDGVRSVLEASLTGGRTLEIFRAVARYLEATLGRSASFAAMLTGAAGTDEPDPDFRPFAEIGAHLIDRLGLRTAARTLHTGTPISEPTPEPERPHRTDPLPWGCAILVGDDPQLDQFAEWLTALDGGGMPPDRVLRARDREVLPRVLSDAIGMARSERRPRELLFLLEYGPAFSIAAWETASTWEAFSSLVRVTVTDAPSWNPTEWVALPSAHLVYSPDIAPARKIIEALSGTAEDHRGAITTWSLDSYLRHEGDSKIAPDLPNFVLRSGRPIPITKRRALVIGIDNDDTKQQPILSSSVDDAIHLGLVLNMAGYHVTSLAGIEATGARIYEALSALAHSSTPDELLWVHVSVASSAWSSSDGLTDLVTVDLKPDTRPLILMRDIINVLATGNAGALVLTDEVQQRSAYQHTPVIPFRDLLPLPGIDIVRVSNLNADSRGHTRGALVRLLDELLSNANEPATLGRLYGQARRLQPDGIAWISGGGRDTVLRAESPLPADTASDAPGQVELVEIPAGPFYMGLTADQLAEIKQETIYGVPFQSGREVDVPAFSIARFPVTNAQYHEFVVDTRIAAPSYWVDGAPPDGMHDHPVVWIGLGRAQQYCAWLANRTGVPYRLPTSTQWEKAARGTDRRRFPWGETLDPSRCAYRKRTSVPVTQYSPAGDSPYGVADLVGNAREWTGSITPAKDYNLATVVVRGGGILANRDYQLWCSYINEITTGPKATIGFRVAAG